MPAPPDDTTPHEIAGATPHVEYHRDGSVWAIGQMRDGVPVGRWEWFRVDGTRLRSGTFDAGVQVGEWTTYDRGGEVYKVTRMKPRPRQPDGDAPVAPSTPPPSPRRS